MLACGVAVPDLWPGVGVVAPPRRVGVEAPLPPLLPCWIDMNHKTLRRFCGELLYQLKQLCWVICLREASCCQAQQGYCLLPS